MCRHCAKDYWILKTTLWDCSQHYVSFVEKKTDLQNVSPLPTIKEILSNRVKNSNPKNFLKIFKMYFINFLERVEGRKKDKERNTNAWEKHRLVVSYTLPTGNLAHNPAMCPDWESNRQPFSSQTGAQSTEPHQPGKNQKNLPPGPMIVTPPLQWVHSRDLGLWQLLCCLTFHFISMVLNCGWFCPSEDICQCLETFSFHSWGGGWTSYWHLVGRDQE